LLPGKHAEIICHALLVGSLLPQMHELNLSVFIHQLFIDRLLECFEIVS
jgi:hypothetical protein